MAKKSSKIVKSARPVPKRGRGRPSLGDQGKTAVLMIRLPAALLARLDGAAGPGGKAALVRAAIERELDRRGAG